MAAIQKVAWTYAWPLNNFDKAVDTLLRYSKDAGLDNNNIVQLKVNAVDYLMRMNPQQKAKAIQLMEECITLDNLHAESIIGSRTTLAGMIHSTDKARSDKLFKEALDACTNQNQFNRVRNHAASVKRE